MRTIGKRKATIGPCKSPSPDLYNRSIIKGTTIEVENIRTKIKQVQQRQQRFELQSSYSQNLPSQLNTSMDSKYRQLYDELNKLKNQNRYLAQQNLLLNQENKRFTLNDERSKTISQLTGALLSKNEKEPLRERLQKEISVQKAKNEQLSKLIQSLQAELEATRQEVIRLASNSDNRTSFNNYQERLTLLWNTIINSFDQTFNAKLEQINSKINKVELMEKIIKQQHSRLIAETRIPRTPTSFKKEERDTLSTSVKPYQDEPSTFCKFSRSIYPHNYQQESQQRLEQQTTSLLETLNNKEHQIQSLKEQNQRITLALKKLQREKGKIKLTPPKSKDKAESDNIKRKHQIEDAVKCYIEELQSARSETTNLHKRLQEVEWRSEAEKRCLLSTIEHLRKIADGKQAQQIQKSEAFLDKDKQIVSLKLSNKQLAMELQSIKNMFSFLNQSLRMNQFQQLLKQNYQIYAEAYHYLENRGASLQVTQDLKQRLLEKEEENYRLATQLALKDREAELLSIELDKLRKLNSQLLKSTRQAEKRQITTSSGYDLERSTQFKRNHSCMVQRLKDGSQKLQLLYDKVSVPLFQIRIEHDNESSLIKSQ